MNRILILLAIITALAISYILITPKEERSKASASEDSNIEESVVLTKEEYQALISEKKKIEATEAPTATQTFIPIEEFKTHSVAEHIESNSNSHKANIQNTLPSELASWKKQYKNNLFLVVDENMSQQTAEFMKMQLMKNSVHLNNTELKQELSEDTNWAYLMEEDIRSSINHHSLSNHFTLLSATCNQLTCEIIGLEKKPDIWHKIYISLLSTIPNITLPSANTPPANFSIKEGDIDITFSTLVFSKG